MTPQQTTRRDQPRQANLVQRNVRQSTLMHRALPSLAFWTALLIGGCAAPAPTSGGAPSVLIELHVSGGGAPTPHQIEKVQEAIAPVMVQSGLQLAESLKRADYVLTATFTPDPVDPNGGRLSLHGLEPARGRRNNTPNPSEAQLKEMQDRVANLERWAQRAEIGR